MKNNGSRDLDNILKTNRIDYLANNLTGMTVICNFMSSTSVYNQLCKNDTRITSNNKKPVIIICYSQDQLATRYYILIRIKYKLNNLTSCADIINWSQFGQQQTIVFYLYPLQTPNHCFLAVRILHVFVCRVIFFSENFPAQILHEGLSSWVFLCCRKFALSVV
jgi:hypothetical protein